ncbi:MAG TPA: GNAT family N-acetyltransferase [Dehalococcoidia bacterium]|jgi:GNAT superfamily N-acetyltransferase|nr:GNAT family N-acetyltransferase [Dehalococcoidia bacterium]
MESMSGEITIRPIDIIRDEQPLKAFLGERDKMRLDHLEPALRDGDCFAYVADDGGRAVGWAVVHTRYREDQDWEEDPEGRAFQSGDNAYLENIEVTPGFRSRGVGRRLIEAVQEEARRRGKRYLWLHTSENNNKAHNLFEREGWVTERSVMPPWRPDRRMRIYRKTLQ